MSCRRFGASPPAGSIAGRQCWAVVMIQGTSQNATNLLSAGLRLLPTRSGSRRKPRGTNFASLDRVPR
jgi:hypothetical protein